MVATPAMEAVLGGRESESRIAALLAEAGAVHLPDSRVPVAELWALYAQQPERRRATEKTKRDKARVVADFVAWLGAVHPEVVTLGEVTEQIAAEYIAGFAAAGKSGQTVNNRLSGLRSVWGEVQIPARLTRNVWSAVGRIEARHEHTGGLTTEEIRALYQAAGKYQGRVPGWWPAAVLFGYRTGLRLGDIATLDWQEIDLDKGEIRLVPNKAWKKGQELNHPLTREMAEWLPERGKGHRAAAGKRKTEDGTTEGGSTDGAEYVWPEIAAAYLKSAPWFYEEFKKLLQAAKIKAAGRVLKFHSLRVSHVSAAREAGVSLDDVQQSVGHGSPAMTEHYNRSQAATRRVAAALPGIGGGGGGK